MANTLVDLVKIYATNTGTGAFALGNAVPSFRGAEALTDGARYGYSIRQGSNYEVGSGVYSLAGGTLSRVVEISSNGGEPINLAPNAVVNFPALAADISRTGPQGPQGPEGPQGPAGPSGADPSLVMYKANNLSDVADPLASRENLEPAVSTIAGTAYTLALGDRFGYKRTTSATAVTVTVPPNVDVAFPVNTVISFEQAGAGALTLVAGVGVTINSRDGAMAAAGQFSVLQIKKVGTDEWTLIGDAA